MGSLALSASTATARPMNPHRARGRNGARVFASVGIGEADAEIIRIALLPAAATAEVRLGMQNQFGWRYAVDFEVLRKNRTVRIGSTWIVPTGQVLPRLTSYKAA